MEDWNLARQSPAVQQFNAVVRNEDTTTEMTVGFL